MGILLGHGILKMSKKRAEFLIEEAIEEAKKRGVKIGRRAVFDWVEWIKYPWEYKRAEVPVSCDAFGAILLKLGKEELVCDVFAPGWLDVIADYLGVTKLWLWKFSRGFDYGIVMVITTKTKDKKDIVDKDKVSRYGNKLANKVCNL